MNRDNVVKVVIISVVSLVIIGIITFIVLIIKKENEYNGAIKAVTGKKINVAEECVFDVTLKNFNRLANNVSAIKLCDSYNKIVINDVTLNEEKVDLYAIYYNGALEVNNKNLGIYLNGKQITRGASFDERNVIRIYDNMLFIKKENIDDTNIVVYNSKGKQKYDFAYELNKIILEDPSFKEDNLKETRVTIENVDINSYIFDEGEFTFETTSQCTSTQEYKGSKYKVTYKDEKFKKPEFLEKIAC